MTTQQARQKFYTKYATGELSMAEAELYVQLVSLQNAMKRNAQKQAKLDQMIHNAQMEDQAFQEWIYPENDEQEEN